MKTNGRIAPRRLLRSRIEYTALGAFMSRTVRTATASATTSGDSGWTCVPR
ncbi:hypothetical protein ACLF6K_16445 [Streptomyces xanthophaeus]|uniref:hypothetical protein n=1 Tax=Streptomyces xanthophaeus TaxID=67385 RepID=UPI00398FFCCE